MQFHVIGKIFTGFFQNPHCNVLHCVSDINVLEFSNETLKQLAEFLYLQQEESYSIFNPTTSLISSILVVIAWQLYLIQ